MQSLTEFCVCTNCIHSMYDEPLQKHDAIDCCLDKQPELVMQDHRCAKGVWVAQRGDEVTPITVLHLCFADETPRFTIEVPVVEEQTNNVEETADNTRLMLDDILRKVKDGLL